MIDATFAGTTISHKTRAFDAMHVVLSEIRTDGGLLMLADATHLSMFAVVLDEVGGHCEPRLQTDRACRVRPGPSQASFVPAGVRCWGYSNQIRLFRSLAVRFDVSTLNAQFSEDFSRWLPTEPVLRFSDSRIVTLAKLLAEECEDQKKSADPLSQLYTESLVNAALVQLQRSSARRPIPKTSGLSPLQLTRVIDYMQENLMRRVGLRALAQLTDLSVSHFCHAFKLSTGLPPYRYHLNARIRRTQEQLIARRDLTLTQIAVDAGFTDQSHFTRLFREVVGVSPGMWQRQHVR